MNKSGNGLRIASELSKVIRKENNTQGTNQVKVRKKKAGNGDQILYGAWKDEAARPTLEKRP